MKKRYVLLALIAAIGMMGGKKTDLPVQAVEDLSAEEFFQRIMNSQGNIKDEERRSDLYLQTEESDWLSTLPTPDVSVQVTVDPETGTVSGPGAGASAGSGAAPATATPAAANVPAAQPSQGGAGSPGATLWQASASQAADPASVAAAAIAAAAANPSDENAKAAASAAATAMGIDPATGTVVGVPVIDPATGLPVTDPATGIPVLVDPATGVPLAPTPAPTPTPTPAPREEDVNLSSTYHEDYDLYELSMNGKYFIYSNVDNGAITGEPVMVDIPGNLNYRMEKDGRTASYEEGSTISAPGSYVITLEIPADTSLPPEDRVIYRAIFRFRVEEVSLETPTPSPEPTQEPEEIEEIPETPEPTEIPEDVNPDDLSEEELLEDFDPSELEDLDTDQMIQEAVGEGHSAEATEGYIDSVGMGITYDESNGYYRYELASGAVFFANVPNGAITNGFVSLTTNDDILFTVYRDGEEIEYTPGTNISAAGSYTIYPHQEGMLYVATYAELEQPLFHFRIPEQYVNDLGVVSAPWGSTIETVFLDDEMLVTEARLDTYYLGEDGEYLITFQTPAGSQSVSFVKDTVPPRFSVQTAANTATFYYRCTDLSSYQVIQKGQVTESGSIINSLDGAGTYTVNIYDTAGNSSSVSLEIEYGLNTAAILFIVLAVALAVGLFVVIKRIRRTFVVR